MEAVWVLLVFGGDSGGCGFLGGIGEGVMVWDFFC